MCAWVLHKSKCLLVCDEKACTGCKKGNALWARTKHYILTLTLAHLYSPLQNCNKSNKLFKWPRGPTTLSLEHSCLCYSTVVWEVLKAVLCHACGAATQWLRHVPQSGQSDSPLPISISEKLKSMYISIIHLPVTVLHWPLNNSQPGLFLLVSVCVWNTALTFQAD